MGREREKWRVEVEAVVTHEGFSLLTAQ